MNKKVRLNIRTKLITTYLLVLLVPSIIIGWLTYQSASSNIGEQLTNNAQESVVAVNQIISSNIQSKIDDILYFAGQLPADSINNEAAGLAAPALENRLRSMPRCIRMCLIFMPEPAKARASERQSWSCLKAMIRARRIHISMRLRRAAAL